MPNNIWTGSDGSPVKTYSVDTDRRDIDVSSRIARLIPDATPFLVVLMRAAKNPVNSLEWTWYDDEPAAWYTEVGGTGYDGTTDPLTMDVTDEGIFKKDDILKNTSTGEVFMVVEDPYTTNSSGGQIKVAREYGYDSSNGTGTQMTVGSAGENLMRMGNAIKEGGLAADPRGTQPSKLFNYIQSFSDTISGSLDDLNEAKKTAENERTRLRREAALKHRLDIERGLLFGERMEHINDEKRLTGGLLQFIKSKSYDVGTTNSGSLTEAEFENYCEELFQYGSKRKLLVVSPRVGSIINQFAKDKIQTVSGEQSYGLRLKQYQSFHGDLFITTSQTFEKDYNGMGVGVDIDNVKYRPFAGNDSKLRANIQEKKSHSWEDEYFTQVGLEVRLEKTHAILSGVQN